MPCLGKPETPEQTARSPKGTWRTRREGDPPLGHSGAGALPGRPAGGPGSIIYLRACVARALVLLTHSLGTEGFQKCLLSFTKCGWHDARSFLAPRAGKSPAGPHWDPSCAEEKAQSGEASHTRSCRGGGGASSSSLLDPESFLGTCAQVALSAWYDYSSCPCYSHECPALAFNLFRVLGALLGGRGDG